MSGNCEGGSCETSKSSCDSESSASSCCACGSNCGGDPVCCGQTMWEGAFFKALKTAQVEILKEKIRKAWGAQLDKAADIILEAQGAQWQAMLAKTQHEAEVREKLAALWKTK